MGLIGASKAGWIAGVQRRDWLLAVAGTCLLPAGAACAQAAAGADLSKATLRAATYKGLHLTLLQGAGLADTPYKIEWKEFASGNLMIEAMNGGSLDFASGSEIPPVFAARSNAKVKVIAVYRDDLNNQVVLAQKASPIKTIADLKGTRVGYVRATTAHYYLQKMLVEAGLSFADIQAVSLSPSDGLSAFARGDLDAWAIYGYNGQVARSTYGARVVKTAVGYLSGNFLIYGHPDAVADPLKHAAITDLMLRIKQAYVWANANPEAYAQLQSKETRVPAADLLDQYRHRSQDTRLRAIEDADLASHQDVADTFLKIGVLDAPVKVAPLWDRSFDKALLASRA